MEELLTVKLYWTQEEWQVNGSAMQIHLLIESNSNTLLLVLYLIQTLAHIECNMNHNQCKGLPIATYSYLAS